MREIKFRTWDKKRNMMSDGLNMPRMFMEEGGISGYLNEEEMPVMQYTGYKDKNGKEVYESDLFTIYGKDWEIYWEDELAGWYRRNNEGSMHAFYKNHANEGEIIGNIYE